MVLHFDYLNHEDISSLGVRLGLELPPVPRRQGC